MSRDFDPPTECPICGAAVPRNARACPGCGADERSGWDEAGTRYDGLDLPDEADDDECPHTPSRRPTAGGIWLVVSVLVLLAVIVTFVFR